MADESNGSNIIWFCAGAAIGAAIALLYAPASGEKTRRNLIKKSEEARESLAESGKEMFERGRDLYDRGRKLADDAADMFERGRKLVENTASKVQRELT